MPHPKGQFGGKWWPTVNYTKSVVSCAKTAVPIEMQYGMLSPVGSRNHVLDGMRTGATWRIRLKRSLAAAMRLVLKLLRPLVGRQLHDRIV